DISSQEFVERDLMLIKVQATADNRAQILELCSIFRGKVVDVAPDQVIVEISGQEKKIEAFIDLMRPFGIVELARTGRIAMVRGQLPEGAAECPPRPQSRPRPASSPCSR